MHSREAYAHTEKYTKARHILTHTRKGYIRLTLSSVITGPSGVVKSFDSYPGHKKAQSIAEMHCH